MLEEKLQSQQADELYEALLGIESKEDMISFLRDLCTLKELSDMIERFQVAKRVANKESYRSIATNVGSSTATITRVAHWYNHGLGGYQKVLERMRQ